MQFDIRVENSQDLEILDTKRLLFPDGIERLITMKRRLWIAMNWLAENNDGAGTYQDTINIAYQLALDFYNPEETTFEDEIRDCFEHSITGSVRAVLQRRNDIIQDNKAIQVS